MNDSVQCYRCESNVVLSCRTETVIVNIQHLNSVTSHMPLKLHSDISVIVIQRNSALCIKANLVSRFSEGF